MFGPCRARLLCPDRAPRTPSHQTLVSIQLARWAQRTRKFQARAKASPGQVGGAAGAVESEEKLGHVSLRRRGGSARRGGRRGQSDGCGVARFMVKDLLTSVSDGLGDDGDQASARTLQRQGQGTGSATFAHCLSLSAERWRFKNHHRIEQTMNVAVNSEAVPGRAHPEACR